MSLARAWRRQAYGASSVALIVPSAMLAALVVLALGGSFSQVGVLGQIFAGPPAPSVAGGTGAGGNGGVAARALPAIPIVAAVSSPPGGGRGGAAGGHRGGVPVSSRGPSQTGGVLIPVRGVAAIVSSGGPAPSGPGPTGSAPSQPPAQPVPPPQPAPSPKPTVVDRIINTITPITQQAPAPVGPAVTQAVQDAGSAADSVLPPGAPAPPSGLKLP